MSLYEDLPPGAQAAYSELFEAAQHAELHRSVASLHGSFHVKDIKNKSYVYYAYRDAISAKVRQIYIAPDSAAIDALKRKAAQAPQADLARLAGAAIVHGCTPAIPRHFRIIRQLADAQFFRAGGILVGAHAYIAMGNMLSIRWREAARTQDIDFAHSGSKGNVALALPADVQIDVHGAIDSLAMGFLPSLSLKGASSGTYISAREPDLRLDFLTPWRGSEKSVVEPALNIVLQPLKFLDYLIEKPTQAALLSPQGGVIVNIPDPARYALHKLIVASERPLRERAKAAKDITQSASVISYCLDQVPHLLRDAWQDLQSRGPGWRKRVRAPLEELQRRYPDVAAKFTKLE